MFNIKYKSIKRLFDFIGSFILIIILSPIFLILIFSILIKDGKPVFFNQARVGIRGKNFIILKFRSMKVSKIDIFSGSIDSKETVKEARKRYRTTELNDERITEIGKIIRSTHLDELPQLINVLKGDMSFVGPRPDVQAQQFDYLEEDWEKRISVKPGITGLAQIAPPNSDKDRTYFDLKYIKEISFFLDVYILFGTLIKLFKYKSF